MTESKNNKSSNTTILVGKILFSITLSALLAVAIFKQYESSQLKKLNYFMPRDFQVLYDLEQGKEAFDITQLRAIEFYYRMLSEYNSQSAMAYGLRGFCAYHLGRTKQSISAYAKAVEINPHFFWYYYNLGLIYYEQRDYMHAAQYLSQALETKNDVALMLIRSSKRIYLPILMLRRVDPQAFVLKQLTDHQRNTYKLIVLSHFHMKNYPEMIRWVRRTTNASPKDASFFLYYAGLATYELRNYKKSVYFLQQSIQRDPNSSEAYAALARTWNKVGNVKEGNVALKRSQMLSEVYPNAQRFTVEPMIQAY